jgi:hypothetical protein
VGDGWVEERGNVGEYGECILYSYYKNRKMKPVEIVLRMLWEVKSNLRYVVSTYVTITMYLPVQLLYTNKII